MKRRLTHSAVVLLVASSAAAQSGASSTSLQLDAAYEHLSSGVSPWRTAGLTVQSGSAAGTVWRVGIRESVRFSRLDHEVTAALQHPLTSKVTASVEGEVSPSHHVLPRWTALGRMQVRVGDAWVVHGSFQHRRYVDAPVHIASTTVERYLRRYRGAYTFYVSSLDGLDTAVSHRIDGNVYYGAGTSNVGLSVSAGDELEHIQPLGVLRTPVRSLSVGGKHWVTRAWFVAYDTMLHEQGALYKRHRVSLTVGRRF
jgi:YaiO family outer membrane protein